MINLGVAWYEINQMRYREAKTPRAKVILQRAVRGFRISRRYGLSLSAPLEVA
jgi:hypothetical protein